jgi:acetylornithine/N-succinyldiaminopimelate aminotransferase
MDGAAPSNSALMATYAPGPVCFVSGSGCWLRDDRGKDYLDFLSGIAVTSLGHCHPAVVQAVERQASRLWHVSNLFSNELAPLLASRIDEFVGDGRRAGGKVFFSNSGAEANECAIKLARKAAGPGRHVVVSALNSFHGRTLATLHATGQPAKHVAFSPLPEGFEHVLFGDLAALEEILEPERVGALLLESIQGEGGVVPAPPGYLEAAAELCRERGILLVLDEIQTGLGRTGRWFGFQHAGISPDIVTLAKALGNGMPIGACWARAEVAEAFVPGDHGSTFGGQPLACSAGLATVDELVRMNAPERAAMAGRRLAEGVGGLGPVAEVRGSGLLLGAVLEAGAPPAKDIVKDALSAGLVLNAPADDVIRLAPPLVVADEEIDQAVGILRGVLR